MFAAQLPPRRRQDALAQHIMFACAGCGKSLRLTRVPQQSDFHLVCPCCRHKGRYNLDCLLDDALEEATLSGDHAVLDAALSLGADVDMRLSCRGGEMTPVAFTVASKCWPGRHSVVRRLIEAKADLDVYDHKDRTLLINAIVHDDLKLFSMLLEGGASPHLPTECVFGRFPLHAVFFR